MPLREVPRTPPAITVTANNKGMRQNNGAKKTLWLALAAAGVTAATVTVTRRRTQDPAKEVKRVLNRFGA